MAAARSILTPEGSRITLFDATKNSRLNDGACDPAGRFLVGSMSLDDRTGEECLYRIEHDGTVTIIDDDLTLSNGLGWSPDATTMYSVDTIPGIVWARRYDAGGGAWGRRRAALQIDDGSPDGLCVDSDGGLWIAIHGAGQVRRYTPSGERTATVDLPAPHTTSVAFVGPQLDTLLITSAFDELAHDRRSAFPLSGHLFTTRIPGVIGLPATPWAGPPP
jgi:sugar lactone lactonase YvrE